MRLCSIHPRYLDAKGLVALWREPLPAKKVLEQRTKFYVKHPQVERFSKMSKPVDYNNSLLSYVYMESCERGYKSDRSKFQTKEKLPLIPATRGQKNFEFAHLLKKLKIRDPAKYNRVRTENEITPNPLFVIVDGTIGEWERII